MVKPPQHLSREAKGWWRKLLTEWELGDDALLLLRAALESFDRCNQARLLLDKDGLMGFPRTTFRHTSGSTLLPYKRQS